MISIEEAKKELREYRDNIKYIDGKQEDAEELRTRIESTASKLSKSILYNITLEMSYSIPYCHLFISLHIFLMPLGVAFLSKLSGMPNGKGDNLDKAPFEESLDKIQEIEIIFPFLYLLSNIFFH